MWRMASRKMGTMLTDMWSRNPKKVLRWCFTFSDLKLRIFNCFVKTEANIWAQVASDVANKHCTRNAPNEGGTCYKGPCPAVWKYGKWSECSTSCGTGKRTKMGICTKNGKRSIGCDESERIIEENCNTHACPVWEVIGDWSKCAAGCGRGTKKR